MGTYRGASGPSLFDSAFFGEAQGAWWVGVVRRARIAGGLPLDIGVRLGSRTPLTGLWRAPDGGLWVTGSAGIQRCPDPWGPDAEQWEVQALDADLQGIVGVDARCVLCWGNRASDGASVLRLYNGARWNPVGAPGFPIVAAHLHAPDHIWVCGGGVARWDGEGWDVLEEPGLVAIHAPTDDQVIVARQDGLIARVTPAGLERLGHVEGAVAVAVYAGRVWVGAGPRGLWSVDAGRAVCVRADRACVSLEVHDDGMLIGCTDLVSSTANGESFPGGCRGAFDSLTLDRLR